MSQARRRKIRTTRQSVQPMARISREGALKRTTRLLAVCPASEEAQRLIDLFGLSAEELAEAGVSYETLKVVESLHPFLRMG